MKNLVHCGKVKERMIEMEIRVTPIRDSYNTDVCDKLILGSRSDSGVIYMRISDSNRELFFDKEELFKAIQVLTGD